MACGVSRDGSKASNVLRAARSYGLEAVGMRREVDEVLSGTVSGDRLLELQSFPRRRGRLARQGLPQRSRHGAAQRFPRGVRQELHRRLRWSSRRDPPSRRAARRPASWRSWGGALKGFNAAIAFVAWVSLMLVIPGMILPGMTAVFVDNVLIRQFDGWLGPMLIGLGVTFLLNVALRYAAGARPAAHRAAAGAGAVGAVRLACAQPSRRVLQPALYRRSREPRRGQRPGGDAAGPRFRQRGGELPDGRYSSALS